MFVHFCPQATDLSGGLYCRDLVNRYSNSFPWLLMILRNVPVLGTLLSLPVISPVRDLLPSVSFLCSGCLCSHLSMCATAPLALVACRQFLDWVSGVVASDSSNKAE
jgi:hypothetical protein